MAKFKNLETAGVAPVTPAAPSLSVSQKSIGQIVREFIDTISTHPDARLLFIDPPVTPEPRESLPRAQLTDQKRCQIKFVYKK